MCRDYTKIFSKIAPCAKGEKKYANIQVIQTIILKISNLEGNFCIVSTHTKLHVQGKKSPFWIFHRGHDVSISLPGSVKKV